MKKNHSTNQELPKSGLSFLPDGRVQVIFDKMTPADIVELPRHVYNLVQELAMVDGELSADGKTGLFFVLQVTKGFIGDDPERLLQALKKAS